LAIASYANPLVEQRDLLSGKAAVALDSKVIRVIGDDRLKWLHALLSQNIVNLLPGQSAEALLLDPQGHIEANLHVVDDGRITWLIVEQTQAQLVFDHLNKMKLRTKVNIELDAELQVFATFGEPLPNANVVWLDPWPEVTPGGHRYAAKSGEVWNYVESIAESSSLGKAGTSALEAIRVMAHRPSMEEVDEKTLPHELDWLATGVHLSKGCYRGQEAVAKVHNLGHPPRRLVLLHLDGSGHLLPEIGAKVYLGETEVGRITTSGSHYEAGAVALAVIKRTVPEDALLEVTGSITASQEVIVPQTAGKTVTIPRKNLMRGSR
jgi:folate-binding protein YgfZ